MNESTDIVYLYSPWNGTIKEYIGVHSRPESQMILIKNERGTIKKMFSSCSTTEGEVRGGVVWYRQPNLKEATIAIIGFLNASSEKQRESLRKHARMLGELPPGEEYDKIRNIAEREINTIRSREELVRKLIAAQKDRSI